VSGDRRAPALTAPSPLGPAFGVTACAVLATAAALIELVAGNAADPQVPPPGSRCWPVWLALSGQGPLALPDPSDPAWPARMAALRTGYPDCFTRPYPDLPLPGLALGAAVLLAGCLLAYAAWPYWRILRAGLVRADTLPEVGGRLRDLAAEAGVRVRFLADLTSPRVTGLAFGHAGRRYVLVNRGLLALARTDPDAFDAVVRHELAHVRHRDVDLAYLTVLAWRLFVAVFLLPVLLLFNDALDRASLDGRAYAGLLAQVFLVAGLVLVGHAAVLRERELAADAWAARRGGAGPLRRIFDAVPRPGDRLGAGAWPRRLVGRLASVHPDPARRTAALADPDAWLAPRAGQAALLGLTAGLTWVPALLVCASGLRALGLLPAGGLGHLPGVAYPGLAPLLVPLGLAAGAAVWRYVARRGRAALPAASRYGLALGAGLAAGDLLTAQGSPLGPAALGPPNVAVLAPGARLVLAGVLLAGAWLTVCGLAGWALAWRRVAGRAVRRPGVAWPLLAVAAVPSLAWVAALLGTRLAMPYGAAGADGAGAFVRYLAGLL